MKAIDDDLLRIQTILERRRPDLVPAFVREVDDGLSAELSEELQLVLNDELLEFGLRDDDEPTEYGLWVEKLVDRLARMTIAPDVGGDTPLGGNC